MFTFHSGSRSWKSEIRVPAARILVRAVFQACLQTTCFSSCVVTWLFLNDCWETEEKEGGRDAGREGERQGRSESFLFFYIGVWLIHTSCSFCCTVTWSSYLYTSLEKTDAGRDWGQEEKGTTEDEMAGWHHWLNGHEFGGTPGVGDGQESLACCNSWGRKESNTTERLDCFGCWSYC